MKKQPQSKLYVNANRAFAAFIMHYKRILHCCCCSIAAFCKKCDGGTIFVEFVKRDNMDEYILLFVPVLWTLLLSLRGVQLIGYVLLFMIGTMSVRCTYIVLCDLAKNKEVVANFWHTVVHSRLCTSSKCDECDSACVKCDDMRVGRKQSDIVKSLLRVFILLFIVDALFIAMLSYKAVLAMAVAVLLYMCTRVIAKGAICMRLFFNALLINMWIWVGWYAISTNLEMTPMVLYAGCVLWAMGRGAMQYCSLHEETSNSANMNEENMNEDITGGCCTEGGVKGKGCMVVAGLLREKGEYVNGFVWKAYKLAIILVWLAGFNCHLNMFFTLLCIFAAYLLYSQVDGLDARDSAECGKRFAVNVDFAGVISLAMLLGVM